MGTAPSGASMSAVVLRGWSNGGCLSGSRDAGLTYGTVITIVRHGNRLIVEIISGMRHGFAGHYKHADHDDDQN
jgi:hypothetical protein